MALPIKSGQRYKAKITLSWAESFADNDLIKQKFEESGFTDVEITGSGYNRIGEGTWEGESVDDASEIVPSQISEIEEILSE